MTVPQFVAEYGLWTIPIILIPALLYGKRENLIALMHTLQGRPPPRYSVEDQAVTKLTWWLHQIENEKTNGNESRKLRRKLILVRYGVFLTKMKSVGRWDVNEMTPHELGNMAQTYALSTITEAENACLAAGIPEEAVKLYRAYTHPIVALLGVAMRVVCSDNNLPNNRARLALIVNMVTESIAMVASGSEHVFDKLFNN